MSYDFLAAKPAPTTSHHHTSTPGSTRSRAFPALFCDGDRRAMLAADLKMASRNRFDAEANLLAALAEHQTIHSIYRARSRSHVLDCVADYRATKSTHSAAWTRFIAHRIVAESV